MRFGKLSALLVTLWSVPLWADVSFVMKFRFEPGSGMPASAVGAMASAMPTMPVVRTQLKGNRSAGQMNGMQIITDNAKGEITLVDPVSKTFASGAMAEYLSAMGAPPTPKMPPEVEKMLSNVEVTSKKTDRTDVIEGIQAGEREIDLSMKMPMPVPPGAGGAPAGAPITLEMKIIMRLWTALPAEVGRVPALRELDALYSSAEGKMTGQNLIQQLSQMLPGGGASMTKLFDELSKERAYPLRTQMEMSMPGMAEMMAQLGPDGAAASAEFPKGPLMTITMELSELSTVTVDDAVFQVPKDYKPVPFSDLAKKLTK